MKVKTLVFFGGLLFPLYLIFMPTAGLAEEKKVYSLEESVAEALANNWKLKAKKEKIDQATYIKKQARAEFLPKLSTSYGYTRLNEPTTFLDIPISTKDNYQWKGTVTQPLFTGFALTSSYRLAELGIDQSKMELELSKLDLVLQVKKAYFQILIADRIVEVTTKDVESRKSNVKVARSFYKVEMIPINDVLKAEVELANSKHNLVKARNASRLARSAFNVFLSRPINTPVDVEDILGFKPDRGDFQEYVDEAITNRPEMKLIDIGIFQIDQQIRLAKSKDYPEVTLQYDYIREGDKPDVSGSPFHDANRWQVMGMLSWTFWEWGKTHYSVKENESLRKKLIQSRHALQDTIGLELKQAVLELQTAEKNIPTTLKAIEQGEENLTVTEKQYKAQMTTITEVLDAQTLLTQARVNYYKALYNHYLARAKLQRALGNY